MVSVSEIPQIVVILGICYLVGSFPTAYLIAKARNVDIFEMGSGNMGGTNVARSLGLGWGLFTALIDVSKGGLAILLARAIMPERPGLAFTMGAIGVMLGHIWSVWATLLTSKRINGRVIISKIRGGKGAATAFGTMLMIFPSPTLVGMWLFGGALVLFTRYVSLGVLAGFAFGFAWIWILVGDGKMPNWVIVYTLMLTLVIIWRFQGNIQRLLAGTERRLGDTIP